MKLLCTRCDEEKIELDFSVNNRRKTGRQAWCKKCSHAVRVQWSRDNKVKDRGYRLKYNYGITQEKLEAMLDSQDNACKICEKTFTEKMTPRIDHDHSCCPTSARSCGKCIRGLLCNRCNLFLGFFENYGFMENVKRYLHR